MTEDNPVGFLDAFVDELAREACGFRRTGLLLEGDLSLPLAVS